jgi:formylglycine-generating enzyme required for sulfatase activity
MIRHMLVIGLGFLMAVDGAASEDKPTQKYTETFQTKKGAKLSFDMVLIPGGTFVMGSPADQAGRADHEGPQRRVQLDPFYLCTTETTLELFLAYYEETRTEKRGADTQEVKKIDAPANGGGVDAITGPTPVYGDMTMGHDNRHPAIGVSWHNAVTFCRWLSKRTGRTYRLPTEAEWEYAARGGTTSVFGFGDDASQLGDFAWYEANSEFGPEAVAKKKASVWGLYDMQGNVREWVHDFYQPTAYSEAASQGPILNPAGPQTGAVHVARGGCYKSPPGELRCAARGFEEDSWRWNDPQLPKSIWWLPQIDVIGFRVARSAGPDTGKTGP